jgi:hypothetical protein
MVATFAGWPRKRADPGLVTLLLIVRPLRGRKLRRHRKQS